MINSSMQKSYELASTYELIGSATELQTIYESLTEEFRIPYFVNN